MSYNNRMVDAMVHSQFDAFKNMYDIELQWPSSDTLSLTNSQEIISVRAKGIKIPDFEIATYERHYHGSKINIPKPEQTFDRQVEVTFTMDAAFQYYQVFCQWASLCGDPVNGGVSNTIPTSLFGQLKVVPLSGTYFANTNASSSDAIQQPSYVKDGNGGSGNAGVLNDAKIYWAFGNCWVSKVTAPEFSVDSSDTLEFAVTFQFLDFDAPGYGGFRTKQASSGGYAPTLIGSTGNIGTGTLSTGGDSTQSTEDTE